MSNIEWTDQTWNPLAGCRKVSEGCRNCYAMRSAHRMARNPNPKISSAYEGLARMRRDGPEWTGKVRLLPDRLEQPLRWRKPRRVFVNSMSDLFHEDVPDEYIAAVFGVMAACPQHTFQVLTKRPERLRVWSRWVSGQGQPHDDGHPYYAHGWRAVTCMRRSARAAGVDVSQGTEWPLPNVWLGTSVESADHVDRIDHLRNTPAAVRFLSIEPLLGPMPGLDLFAIDWVIVGDESGPGRRPADLDWVRDIRDQCIRQGVAFFFKQWHFGGVKTSLPVLDGQQWAEWPKGSS